MNVIQYLDAHRAVVWCTHARRHLLAAGRIIMSDEIGRIKGFLEFERIEAVSDSMRELIEDLWPELVHRLQKKKPQAWQNAGQGREHGHDLRGVIMLKKTEAEAVLKKCRGLIDEIIAGLSAEKPLVNTSSAAELLFYLEFAASALKKSAPRARKRRETKIVTSIIRGTDGPARASNRSPRGRG
jgi:hypothetical protein